MDYGVFNLGSFSVCMQSYYFKDDYVILSFFQMFLDTADRELLLFSSYFWERAKRWRASALSKELPLIFFKLPVLLSQGQTNAQQNQILDASVAHGQWDRSRQALI